MGDAPTSIGSRYSRLPIAMCLCPYCFQNEIDSQADRSRIRRRSISSRVIDGIVDYAERIVATDEYRGFALHLFGGEPLMAYRECCELLGRLQGKGMLAAAAASNGSLLTPARIAELSALGLTTVQVTFDGDRENHDATRATRSGRGTYDRILRNVRSSSESAGISWVVRVNMTYENIAGLNLLAGDIVESFPPERTIVYFTPVIDYGLGVKNESISTRRSEEVIAECCRLLLVSGFTIPPPLGVAQRCAYCDDPEASTGSVIDPEGRLYSCWDRAGRPELAIGDIWSGRDPRLAEANWFRCADEAVALPVDDGWRAIGEIVDLAVLRYRRAHPFPELQDAGRSPALAPHL